MFLYRYQYYLNQLIEVYRYQYYLNQLIECFYFLFIRNVCALSECPLALTSANYSAGESTLAVEEFSSLHPRWNLHGICKVSYPHEKFNIPSTILLTQL